MARIVFMGSPDFAVPSLERLLADGHEVAGVFSQPDREAGRGRALTAPPVKAVAVRWSLPVFQPERLRGPDTLSLLQSLAPDLIVVAAYGKILRPEVLALPPHGVLNVHASLLPRWRGASPIQAAIAAGDDVTGVCIMLVGEGLDTGPVLSRRTVAIGPHDTAGTLTDRLAETGAALLAETLPRWLAGELVPEPQDETVATYAPRIEKDAGRIEWNRSALAIWRQVRACNPWPMAYTLHGELPLRIHEAWPLPGAHRAEPGAVVPLQPGDAASAPAERPRPAFAVQTGDGLLLPLLAQRPGKRALFAEEFLRGERGLIGARLG